MDSDDSNSTDAEDPPTDADSLQEEEELDRTTPSLAPFVVVPTADDDDSDLQLVPDAQWVDMYECTNSGLTFLGHKLTGELPMLPQAGGQFWQLEECAEGFAFAQPELGGGDSPLPSQWASDILQSCVYRDEQGRLFVEYQAPAAGCSPPTSIFKLLEEVLSAASAFTAVWACDDYDHVTRHTVYHLESPHHGAAYLWKIQDIHRSCCLSAGGQWSSTWVHKRLPGLRKALAQIGLPLPVQGIPYQGSRRAADRVVLDSPALSTAVHFLQKKTTKNSDIAKQRTQKHKYK